MRPCILARYSSVMRGFQQTGYKGDLEPRGEGMPRVGHSDGNRETNGRKHQRSRPHCRAMDAADGDPFEDQEHNEENAESSDRSSRGREPDTVPRETAECGGDEPHGCIQDEALMCVRPAAGSPRGVDDDGESG